MYLAALRLLLVAVAAGVRGVPEPSDVRHDGVAELLVN
jgi:hypothetical protein